MTMKEFSDFLDKKIEENEHYIKITYYELRVKYNLSKQETADFLELAKNKFENLKYDVYFTGDEYIYPNFSRTVQDNELMIAIKFNKV